MKPETKENATAAVKNYLTQLLGNSGAFEIQSVSEPELRKVRDNQFKYTTVVYVRFKAISAQLRTVLSKYCIFAIVDGKVIQACATTDQSQMFGK